jgi:hypothetical protein
MGAMAWMTLGACWRGRAALRAAELLLARRAADLATLVELATVSIGAMVLVVV